MKMLKTITSKIRIAFGGLVITGVLGMGAGCETIDTDAIMSGIASFSAEDGVTSANIEDALREALVIGTNKAVELTSSAGGYAQNPLIKIPLPAELEKIGKTLKSIGLGSYVTDFEAKMNEAAEQAAALAAPVFSDAVTNMSFDDVQKVFSGGDTAATDYFKKSTGPKLQEIYAPIVKEKMREVGAVSLYTDMVKRYNQVPFVKKVDFNVENYVTDQALDGLFDTLALEEKQIRENPAARTTELLKKVFGSVQ